MARPVDTEGRQRRRTILPTRCGITALVCFVLFGHIQAGAATLAEWRSDEFEWVGSAGEVVDSTGNGFDGVAQRSLSTAGDTPAVAGDPGTCYYGAYVRSARHRVRVDYDAGLNPDGDFSVTLWARVTGQQGRWRSPITSRSTGGSRRGFNVYAGTNNRWQFWTGRGNGWDILTGPTVTVGSWVHLSFTYQSQSKSGQVHTGISRMYVNGALVATRFGHRYRRNTNRPLWLGAGTGNGGNHYFEGGIDEVRVHDTTLTAGEINTIINDTRVCPVPPPAPPPVAEWRAEESWIGNTGEVIDETGNGHNGTADGAFTEDVTPANPADPGTCRYGAYERASRFRVIVPHAAAINPSGDFTITSWVRVTGQQGQWRSLISSRDTAGGRSGFTIYAGRNNRWEFWTGRGGGWDRLQGPAVQVGVWLHIAVVYNSIAFDGTEHTGTKRMYINGSLVATRNNAHYRVNNANDLYIGAGQNTGTNYFFEGNIDETRIYPGVLTESDIQTVRDETHPCPPPVPLAPPVAEWQMEQGSWNGNLDEVVDETGNGHDGVADNGATTSNATPALPADPGTCRYGEFDRASLQRVRVDYDAALNPDGDFSLAGWVRVTGDQGEYRSVITSRGIFSNARQGYNIYAGDNNRWQFWTGRGGGWDIQTGPAVAVGAWTHVAVTYDAQTLAGANHRGVKRMYINGALVATRNNARYRANTAADLYLGAGGTAGSSFHFEGDIDEMRVYDRRLSPGDVSAIMAETHPCTVGVDHYAVTHAGTAITCEAAAVTITGHDAATPVHGEVEPETTITITTVPNTVEIALRSGSGPFTPGTGTAQYTYPAGETSAEFWFSQTSAASVNVSVVDLNGQMHSATESDPLVFSDTGFQFYANAVHNMIGPQIAGKGSDTAPGDQALTLRAVETNTDTGACEARLLTTPVAVDMAYQCVSPNTCQNFSGVNITSSQTPPAGTDITGNNAGPVGSYTPVNLDFGTDGTAIFVMNYADAGQISLHARLNLPAAGDDPAIELAGTSNVFTVRPAGLCVEAPQANSSCTAPDITCSRFQRAGENFTLSVRGVAWETAGESNDDFCTTNPTTPNFQLANILLAPTVVAPAGSPENGVLARDNLDITSGGEETLLDQQQSEVGIFTITATPQSTYFGETIAASTSASIGRFYPGYFDVSLSPSVTPAFAPTCSTFTYQDETFNWAIAPRITVQAYNVNNQETRNYEGDFFLLTTDLARSFTDNVGNNATLTATPDPDLNVTVTQQPGFDGAVEFEMDAGANGDSFVYNRVDPDPAFDADVDVEVELDAFRDTDGVCFDTGQDGCDPFPITGVSGTELRFGRLALENAFGSELQPLAMNATVEYFNGDRFVPNDADSCTMLALSTAATTSELQLSNPVSGLLGGAGPPNPTIGSGETSLSVNPVSFAGGTATLLFAAPGSGNTGFVDVITNLGPAHGWLRFNWDGTPGAFDQDTTARASFGLFPGREEIIYIREPWD